MIDWHSHILPELDDGSRNAEQSLAMLASLRDQGIKLVVATPHFQANEESVQSFLERREASFKKLSEKLTNDLPKLVCGAEVEYFPGISQMTDIDKLKIGETDFLLIEMPMDRWADSTIKELIDIASSRDLIIAHMERYMDMQTKGALERIFESGIFVQVNSIFFKRGYGRKKAIKLLRDGKIHFIGTDCHDLKIRPPQIFFAYETIRKKLGEEFLFGMNEYGRSVFDI